MQMKKWRSFCLGFAVFLLGSLAMAQELGVVKPQLLLREIVQGMPKGEKQEVRVLPYTPFPSDCLCIGRRVHARNGGSRGSHSESWSSHNDAGARENDRLQPQQHRAIATGAL